MLWTKQVTCDDKVVTFANDTLAWLLTLKYMKDMKRLSIDDVIKYDFEVRKEARLMQPHYRKFLMKYEKLWNKNFMEFNIFEKDLIRVEFLKEYKKLKNKGE